MGIIVNFYMTHCHTYVAILSTLKAELATLIMPSPTFPAEISDCEGPSKPDKCVGAHFVFLANLADMPTPNSQL